jgi:hypothetical protein
MGDIPGGKDRKSNHVEGGKNKHGCWQETKRQVMAGSPDADLHRSVVTQGLYPTAVK